MTLKGEIAEIILRELHTTKSCSTIADEILSAIKGRVPKEKPETYHSEICNYAFDGCYYPTTTEIKPECKDCQFCKKEEVKIIENIGFNEARNQFLNEVEG